MRVDGVVHPLTEPPKLKKQEKHTIEVIVDRLAVKESAKHRLTDSVETALGLAGGLVVLDFVDLAEDDPHRERRYSERLACPDDDLSVEELEPRSFSFNSPFGACPACTGIGTRMEVDADLVVPDPDPKPGRRCDPPWAGARPRVLHRLLAARRRSRLLRGHPVGGAVRRAQKAVLHGAAAPVTSTTGTATAGSTPTRRFEGACRTSGAGKETESATTARDATTATCARCPAPPATVPGSSRVRSPSHQRQVHR